MIALIIKDIATLKRTLLLSFILCIALSVYSIYSKTLIMIPLMCVFMPLILNSIAFGYDVQSKFEQFAFSMPIKKSSYVFSKLFFSFAFSLVASIIIFILLLIEDKIGIDKIILISILSGVSINLLPAIQLPFILKFGAEKGRIIVMITFLIIFAISNLLGKLDIIPNLIDILSFYSFKISILSIIILFLVVLGVSIKSSINIMEKKQY
ncbi:ABC-2 transporter permease [Anaerococcus sp. AGMB00486]|uniref:ABC-2 transporter permease n=2 Tax=Anaerococcus TaxID=165779 RepID=A0ABX2N7W5_9FIRM|nr:ABC-2 transporter permease [Anaerococcus porci]NVF10773.1 ABC-2 transporter permease [Anaerococcus faecalis]